MRLKKDNPATTCGACGQALPMPAIGTILYNPFRNTLGTVIAPVGTAVNSDALVTVSIITGAQAGQRMNWYVRNVERVTGHFHIETRAKAR